MDDVWLGDESFCFHSWIYELFIYILLIKIQLSPTETGNDPNSKHLCNERRYGSLSHIESFDRYTYETFWQLSRPSKSGKSSLLLIYIRSHIYVL